MSKTWLIARREYLYNLRRRSFLFGAFIVPVFVIVIMLVAFSLTANSEENVESIGQVGYVDHAGVLAEAIDRPEQFVAYNSEVEARQALEEKNVESIGQVGYVDQAGVLSEAIDRPEQFVAYNSEAEARQALEGKNVGAYFVLPEDYMQTGIVQLYATSSIPDGLHDLISQFLTANLSARLETGLPAQRIQEPVNLTVHVEDSGRTLTDDQIGGLFFTPIIFVMVFAMASQITSGFLMSGVVEEKTNRIMEILITSVTPIQLLTGKIIGLGLLGLTQLAVWAVAGFVLLRFGSSNPFLSGIYIPFDLILISGVYFILSYFLMASIMAGIGAVLGSEQESRQVAGMLSLVLFLPIILIVTFILDPEGPVPTVLTLIPFTAPISVLLRMSFGVVPAWQLLASFLITLLATVLVTWASARVFRWALLLYGKRPGPREILRVIRESPHLETTLARSEEAR